MRWIVLGVGLLAGCDSVFGLHRPSIADARDSGGLDGDGAAACPSGVGVGGGGLLSVCLEHDPPATLSVPSINTSVDCTQILTQSDSAATTVCVVAAHGIVISGGLRAYGSLPLVLVALDTIDIGGALDVSSAHGKVAGAGADRAACDDPSLDGGNGGIGGGGGAGGSSGSSGGLGGAGSMGSTPNINGGLPIGQTGSTFVHGGCHGGFGGDGGNTPIPPGQGGGAIYLLAGTSIVVAGSINASGGGGSGGNTETSGSAGGGGGGGSGGMIVLDAPHVTLTGSAKLVANGGGGGGGGGAGGAAAGSAGHEAALSDPAAAFPALGGDPGLPGGANGGEGGSAVNPGGFPGLNATSGAGGGGGGAGEIWIYTPLLDDQGAALSPSRSQ